MTTVSINNRNFRVINETKTSENSILRTKHNVEAMMLLAFGKSETVYMANRMTDGTITGLSKH